MDAGALLVGLFFLFAIVLLFIGWARVRTNTSDFSPRTLFRFYAHLISFIGAFLALVGAANLITAVLGQINENFVFSTGGGPLSSISNMLNLSSPSQSDLERSATISGIVFLLIGLALWGAHRYILNQIEDRTEFFHSAIGALYNWFVLLATGLVAIASVVTFFINILYGIFFNGESYSQSNPPGTYLAWSIVFVIAAIFSFHKYDQLLHVLPKPATQTPSPEGMQAPSMPTPTPTPEVAQTTVTETTQPAKKSPKKPE